MAGTRSLQILMASAIWLCGSLAQAASAILPPPDPAQLSPHVRRAVDELQSIVAKRDLAALERHTAPDAKMSFGGASPGAAGLRELWKPELADTELWRELDRIVKLGGIQTSEGDKLVWSAPYPAFAGSDDLYDDPFSTVIVTGSAVALRAGPSMDSRVIARVDYAVLNNDCNGTEHWTCIGWKGQPAYVNASLVRSPVDYRLAMEVAGKAWFIVFFLAGD